MNEPDSTIACVEDTRDLTTTRAAEPPAERVKTATEMRVVEVSEALAPAYAKASTLELTDDEVKALMAPFPDTAVDIRPHDGLCFISHIHISDRLNAVFKPGKWALVCRRHWLEGGTLYGEYIMLIRGCFVGESVGGHQYQPNNPKTNYSDTLESTAAEALRRIAAKRLSCGSQVWHKDYAEKWVANNAEQRNGKWYKKAIAVAPTPRAPAPKPVTPPAPLTIEQRKAKLFETLKGFEPEADTIFRENGLVLEGESFKDISDFTLERIQPANLLALIKEVKQRKAEADQVPDAEVPEAQCYDKTAPEPVPDSLVGIVEETNQQNGKTKAGKNYTKFGIKISGQWTNTFSRSDYDLATALKGKEVLYTTEQTQFGYDLKTIAEAGDLVP